MFQELNVGNSKFVKVTGIIFHESKKSEKVDLQDLELKGSFEENSQ